MAEDWVVVHSTTFLQGAELIKGMLHENGIEAVVMNRQDSSYVQFGEVEVLVNRNHVIRAKHLINSFREEEE
jgi:hypothetical protein